MPKQIISTDQAPAAVGPYSQAVSAAGLLYVSGQIGLDPATGKLVDGGVEAQARQVLANIEAILAAAGLTTADVIKTTVLLTDIGDFAAVNAIYAEHFPEAPPARAAFAVSALPLGSLVEIETIAATHQ
jgi:2-iminobutanoate/2-iminopropanoate deaminase